MAKDDFFVIAYKIMAYLYACMKAGEEPQCDEISPERFNIPEKYWYDIITNLYNKGYIDGVKEVHAPWQKQTIYRTYNTVITIEGIEYLENNSTMAKAKETLKDLKAMIPMI
jgi:hypothetical protein